MPIQTYFRPGATTSLNVTSGTVVASAVFGSQTRMIRMISSAASCNILISDAAVASTAVDTGGVLVLPSTAPEFLAVGPGQRLNVHSQTVTSSVLWVTEGLG